MIAKLSGMIDSIGEDSAVIDVAGVGYLVFCSGRCLAGLGSAGKAASLIVETHVREDHIHLYGFTDRAERDWFRLLTTVQGVGAKVSLALLTALGPDHLSQAVAAGDRAALTRAVGVGARLAARILSELEDRNSEIAVMRTNALDSATRLPASGLASREDAVSALVNLGYGRGEAFGAVAHAMQDLGHESPVEDLIKAGLKGLGA